jgi:hypothetical protein
MSDFNSKNNRVVWMDIYVDDLDRACAFYEAVLAIECTRESFGEVDFAVLEHKDGNGGCLVPRPEGQKNPNWYSVMVYLNADGRIRDAVAQVEKLGGRVALDVHPIGPHGFRALIEDSEGNPIALHSNTDA